MTDLYSTLGVGRDADAAAIKKAYRKASKRAHPDGGGSAEKFRAVSRALEVLSDPVRRRHYDETGTVDDKPADNELADVMQTMSGLMDQVLGAAEQNGEKWECVPIIDRMLRVSRDLQTRAHQDSQKMKVAADGQRKLVDRFKKKDGGENRMSALLTGRIAFLEAQQAVVARRIETLKKVDAMLAEYRFDAEKSDQRYHQGPMMMQIFSTMGT